MVRGRSSWKTWKTTRNLADYEGPLRRGRICRAVCPSLLSRSRIFWVKSSRRGSLSLSLSRRLGFVGGVRLQRMKKRRDRVVFCARTTRAGAPCRGNPVCPAHNGFGRVLSASCRLFFRILLPFFLHLPADSLSARADKLDPEKIFSAANTLNEHHQLGKLELERKVSIYGDGFVGIWVGWNIYIYISPLRRL